MAPRPTPKPSEFSLKDIWQTGPHFFRCAPIARPVTQKPFGQFSVPLTGKRERKIFVVHSPIFCITCELRYWIPVTQVEIPSHMNGGLQVEGEFFEMHKVPDSNIFVIIKDASYRGGTKCHCRLNTVSTPGLRVRET